MHIRHVKQKLNHGLQLKKVHRVTNLNQKAWLKPHIDVNIELKAKKLMNNAVFWKTMKNMKKTEIVIL